MKAKYALQKYNLLQSPHSLFILLNNTPNTPLKLLFRFMNLPQA